MSTSPLFFLPAQYIMELFGAPKGTGKLKLLAERAGTKLPLDVKTLRKGFGPEKRLSQKQEEKLLSWMDDHLGDFSVTTFIDELNQNKRGRYGETDWRSLLVGLRSGSKDTFFPQTITYISSLLDQERAYFDSVYPCKDEPEKLMRAMATGSFYLKYGIALPEKLIQNVLQENPHDPIDTAVKAPEVIHSLLHGTIRLYMDIFARAEVEWFEENRESMSEVSYLKSYMSAVLPKVVNGKLSLPVTSFFHLAKTHFGFNSWEAMAEYVEVDGMSDIESQKRKLLGWVQGNRYPKFETIEHFLNKVVQSFGDYKASYYENLYLACAFMNRLLGEMAPVISRGHVSVQQLEEAFSTYSEYFEEHQAEAAPAFQADQTLH